MHYSYSINTKALYLVILLQYFHMVADKFIAATVHVYKSFKYRLHIKDNLSSFPATQRKPVLLAQIKNKISDE